ncbi:MAG: PAS domain S-box protein [Chloroflexi bacterium]|nr:MAG: PAS domain S-box protein [Chloroflexota bacterium]TME04254.1 MAG: PAS domain S-box protein [Chloroflexota bacterium]TME41593.1 MAG: PAS domain S-box protein [Chloroflexota bacterium]TME51811.1 MAG: PAS domain S-box protein [Chloroflexota bacterium]
MLRKSNTAEPRDLGDQFALLVSSVVDYGIFMLDPSGVVVTWNEGAQRIKGYAATEIIGRHFSVFYPAEEIRNRKPDWELEVARREGRYEEEGWRIRKDGTRFWANVIITALRDESGRLRGFGKVTRDLTEPRAQEIQRNLDREKEALQLRAHAERMAELERTKTHFLNLASHELRGPLTVVRGYNSMLADGSIPPDQVPAVSRMLEIKLAQMERLIEQMLDTARLEEESNEPSRETFDLRFVAQEQIDVFRPLSGGHVLVLDGGDGKVLVSGDRLRIAMIVANLLDNALKYSPQGGEVQCRVGVRDGHAFISVRDVGLGIAPEHISRLFMRFGRLPTDENVTIPGTGLGLFLCKEIAARHGGDITVVSVPGMGSEFTLTLPSAG